jgi:putative endonuclease
VVEVTLATLTLSLERRIYTRLRDRADRRSLLPPHLLTGQRGEDSAFFHLRSLGYTIVARRWHASRVKGDLDLVAWDGPTLVIFEVKTRTARDLAPAESQVDDLKQLQLRKLAAAYLKRLPELHRASVRVRFDILSVYLLLSGQEFEHVFEHIQDAFPLLAPSRPRF